MIKVLSDPCKGWFKLMALSCKGTERFLVIGWAPLKIINTACLAERSSPWTLNRSAVSLLSVNTLWRWQHLTFWLWASLHGRSDKEPCSISEKAHTQKSTAFYANSKPRENRAIRFPQSSYLHLLTPVLPACQKTEAGTLSPQADFSLPTMTLERPPAWFCCFSCF